MNDLSRRTLVKGAGWTVPPLVMVAAAPMVAASPVAGDQLVVQAVSFWGGGGQHPQGNFVVQAISGVKKGDQRTLTITVTATLYVVENGKGVKVGQIALTPTGSVTKKVDGGSQQFTFAEPSLTLVKGKSYYVVVMVTAVLSSGGTLSATGMSQTSQAW